VWCGVALIVSGYSARTEKSGKQERRGKKRLETEMRRESEERERKEKAQTSIRHKYQKALSIDALNFVLFLSTSLNVLWVCLFLLLLLGCLVFFSSSSSSSSFFGSSFRASSQSSPSLSHSLFFRTNINPLSLPPSRPPPPPVNQAAP